MCAKNCKGAWCGCTLSTIMKVLVIVGGVNWGLVGLGYLLGGVNLNLVNIIFGGSMLLEAIVYVLVGVAAIMSIWGCKCSKCTSCQACGEAVEAPKSETPNMENTGM